MEELRNLQIQIEEYTNDFTDPENVSSRYPHIMEILIHKDKPTAKEYIFTKKLTYLIVKK